MSRRVTALHISDIHFGSDLVTFSDLQANKSIFSKRFLGWINNGFFRRRRFSVELRERLLKKISLIEWDYLIISGDLTTFGMELEFIEARKFIRPLLEKGEVILTSGNHDRYVPDSLKPDLLARYFHDCFPFRKTGLAEGTPYLLLGDDAALIEIDMSLPRALFSSRGKIRVSLEERGSVLSGKFGDKIKIAVGHYPCFFPDNGNDSFLHSLSGKSGLRSFLVDNNIDLYLHGHIHKSWSFKPDSDWPLVCVNSGGCCRHKSGVWAGFHRIILKDGRVSVERLFV